MLDAAERRPIEGSIRSVTSPTPAAVAPAEVVVFAVGTPSAPDGTVNMDAMGAAVEQVARAMESYTVLVTKTLSVTDAPLRLTGPLGRWLNYFVRF